MHYMHINLKKKSEKLIVLSSVFKLRFFNMLDFSNFNFIFSEYFLILNTLIFFSVEYITLLYSRVHHNKTVQSSFQ